MNPQLSVIVCVYNEAGNNRPLIAQIDSALTAIDYELIYVNDGSTDQTLTELQSIANQRLTVIDLQKNYGQSSALAAGIDAARGQFIVTMDGDGQNDPLDIIPMLKLARQQDVDLVVGIRQARQDNALLRKLPSRIANALIRRTTGVRIDDTGCALKLFRAETAKSLGLYGELHRFIPALAHLDGARIAQLPVRHHPRRIGQSKYGLGRTMRVLSDLVLLLFMKRYGQKPMHLFGGVGLWLVLAGIIGSVSSLVPINSTDTGWLIRLLIGSTWLLAGLQFLAFGLILELQMRTYYESQGKKPYNIRRVYRPVPLRHSAITNAPFFAPDRAR